MKTLILAATLLLPSAALAGPNDLQVILDSMNRTVAQLEANQPSLHVYIEQPTCKQVWIPCYKPLPGQGVDNPQFQMNQSLKGIEYNSQRIYLPREFR